MGEKQGFLQKIKENYKKVDLFGSPTTFFYNGEEEFKSAFGATLTIIVVGIALWLSFSIIKQGFLRTGIEFKSDTVFTPEPEQTNMTTKQFHLAVSLEDQNHSFNYSMVGMRIRWANYTRLKNGTLIKTKIEIPMKPCVPEDFTEFPGAYEAYRFDLALCPIDFAIPTKGVFLSDNYQFLEFVVEECNNVTHALAGITCAPKDAIDAYFLSAKVKAQIFFKNFIVNPSNLDNPFVQFLDNFYFIINQGILSKSVDVFIRDAELTSAQNFFNADIEETTTTYRVDTQVSDQIFVPTTTKDKGEFLSVQFRKGTTKFYYSRIVIGLADMAARFGGIWGILYGFCSIIATTHNNIGYQKSLADTMFRFENVGRPKPNKKGKEPNSPGKAKKKNSHSPTKVSESSEPKAVDNMLSKGVITEQKAFSSTLKYLLTKIFCIRTKEYKLKLQQQEEGLELAKRKVDVMFVLKKLQEFEKLKYVLLDKNQRILFDYIPPPLVVHKEHNEEINQLNKNRSKEVLNAIKYYDPKNELMEKYKTPEEILALYNTYKLAKYGDDVSKKLVDMLGLKILTIFRYLDHMMSDKEEIERRRARGLKKAIHVLREKVKAIRERKVLDDEVTLDFSRLDEKKTDINTYDLITPMGSFRPFSPGFTPLISPNNSMSILDTNRKAPQTTGRLLNNISPRLSPRGDRVVQQNHKTGVDIPQLLDKIKKLTETQEN